MKKKAGFSAEGPDRLNVLVEGTKIKGDIQTESSIRLDGEVNGNMKSASKVVIGKNGILIGDLSSNEADIEGVINGTLRIEGLLVLRASAAINGDIECTRIQIEDGAQFSGNCIMGNQTIKPQNQDKQETELVY